MEGVVKVARALLAIAAVAAAAFSFLNLFVALLWTALAFLWIGLGFAAIAAVLWWVRDRWTQAPGSAGTGAGLSASPGEGE